jgi:hypothetical protein
VRAGAQACSFSKVTDLTQQFMFNQMAERLANSGSLINTLGTPDKPKFPQLLNETLAFTEPKYTLSYS